MFFSLFFFFSFLFVLLLFYYIVLPQKTTGNNMQQFVFFVVFRWKMTQWYTSFRLHTHTLILTHFFGSSFFVWIIELSPRSVCVCVRCAVLFHILNEFHWRFTELSNVKHIQREKTELFRLMIPELSSKHGRIFSINLWINRVYFARNAFDCNSIVCVGHTIITCLWF